jgi:hypothetical protein
MARVQVCREIEEQVREMERLVLARAAAKARKAAQRKADAARRKKAKK